MVLIGSLQAAGTAAALRRASAKSTATAQEAMRARTESAREVRMIGTRAPSTIPAAVGLGEERQVLCQHVAGFEVGHDQDLRTARNRRLDTLDLRRLRVDRVVESERTIENATGDLAALGHLAQRGGVDGRGDLRGHRLDRRENSNPRSAEADLGEQIDRVLHDVALGFEVGKYVDGGVRDEQRLRIGRHIHDEDVADPARSAQAGLAGGHLAHQLVRVQAPLHQELAFALVDQLHGLGRGRVAVRRVDDLETTDVEPVALRHGGRSWRPDQQEWER